MIRKISITASFLLAIAPVAYASSDSAWEKMFAKATGTCVGQSGMIGPDVTAPVVFDDSIGKIAILLRETAGKNKSRPQNVICLYDKKTGKAAIEEFRWLGK